MNNNSDIIHSPLLFEKHELLLDIMKMFNISSSKNDIINTMLGVIQSHMGIEAIALRIQEGNDCPYFACRGFSEDFIRSERLLACGDAVTDTAGYECICGMILEGDTDQASRCFTRGGSFMINSSDDPDLAAMVKRGNRKFRLRCISEGYRSIALVPVRSNDSIIGIMQFNDRRGGIFSHDTIEFIESCCSALGLALHRRNVDFGMKQINSDLESIIEERTIELLKTIKDKDRLLDEVNHRIKNNLLIISSLLNLQAMKESNQQIRDALNGAVTRINSMGIIHQKLYSSRDLDHINIEEYIIALYNRTIQAYNINPSAVDFSLKCGGITVNIDTAIPCGLIINEILSNSIRHAFTNGKKLLISITIEHTGNTYNMVVCDNGPGLKPGFNIGNDGSLGMELIRALVKQLDGTLDVYNNEGLVCDIKMNREFKEENRWKQKMS